MVYTGRLDIPVTFGRNLRRRFNLHKQILSKGMSPAGPINTAPYWHHGNGREANSSIWLYFWFHFVFISITSLPFYHSFLLSFPTPSSYIIFSLFTFSFLILFFVTLIPSLSTYFFPYFIHSLLPFFLPFRSYFLLSFPLSLLSFLSIFSASLSLRSTSFWSLTV